MLAITVPRTQLLGDRLSLSGYATDRPAQAAKKGAVLDFVIVVVCCLFVCLFLSW